MAAHTSFIIMQIIDLPIRNWKDKYRYYSPEARNLKVMASRSATMHQDTIRFVMKCIEARVAKRLLRVYMWQRSLYTTQKRREPGCEMKAAR